MNFSSFYTYLSSEKRCSPHTLDAYRNDLSQFATFCSRSFEITSPVEVTPPVVRSWIAELVEEKYQATTVHRKLSSVNAFFRFILRQGQIKVNPAKGLAKPKKPHRLPTFVEEKGMMKLYDLAPMNSGFSEIRDRLIVRLFYETGIRLSELLQLTDNDVDFSLGQVKILGKRNKMRYVPVSGDLLSEVKIYLHQRDAREEARKSITLFMTDKGEKVGKSFVYTLVKSYLSGVTTLKKKSPHVLRHTFATHMLNNGAELNVIKEILGHSSLAATQIYTHNSIEKLKGVHTRMHPRNK
ncbi:MAG: tyrosine-type recombinase/integrase [Crocinitomicaceae bacterium]|nr:tyrosine-type recombinase/integrase [Crocinitomicaceae bacterium]